jgi:uncharacterized membrane protein YjdF
MNHWVKRFEIPIIAVLLVCGGVFLLKMAYLGFYFGSLVGILYMAAAYFFVRMRYGIKAPLILLFLVYISIALDGLGNLFGFYRTSYKYIQYDEFTHTAVPALTAPLVVWVLRAGLNYFGYRLPLGLTTFFALTTMFTLSGFYEVIELWDDKYMWPQPGMRIHGPYDTANDLQCDLIGIVIGGLIAYAILKRRERMEEASVNGLPTAAT